MLGQRRRRWTSIGPTLLAGRRAQLLVRGLSAGQTCEVIRPAELNMSHMFKQPTSPLKLYHVQGVHSKLINADGGNDNTPP